MHQLAELLNAEVHLAARDERRDGHTRRRLHEARRQCVGELCRVSRHRVIVDFPALGSVAAVQSVSRRLARAAGANVEAYRVLGEAAVRSAFESHGFRVTRIHRQFVLPIALHKRLGSRAATERLEGVLAGLGLLRLAGSPVTVLAER